MSLWYIEHESPYRVSVQKYKDTNSFAEAERWVNKDPLYHAASFFRKEDELNADYVQFLNLEE